MKYQLYTNASKKIDDLRLIKICWELNYFFYDPSQILQASEFIWTLPSSV